MKKLIIVVLALVAGGLSGCVSVHSTRLGSGPVRPATAPDQVAIYRTAEQVPNPYEEVALLSAEGDYQWTNEGQMYQRLRVAAAKLGANAVVLDSVTEPSIGSKVAKAILDTSAPRRGKAIAVYVRSGNTADRKDEPARPGKE